MRIDPSIPLLKARIRELETALKEVIDYIENDASDVPWMGDWKKVLGGNTSTSGSER